MAADAGPSWTDVLTAIGTVGATCVALVAAGVAVWIARWSDAQATKRLGEQRADDDVRLQGAQKAADDRLAEEQDRADKRLADERKAADDRLERQLREAANQLHEERLLAQDREQLAQAWAVQVVGARMPPGETVISTPENPSERPVVIVVNGGSYTISHVDARFGDGQATYAHENIQVFEDFANLPFSLGHDLTGKIGEAYLGVLTPGAGTRFIGGAIQGRYLRNTYAIVRWSDHWGGWWEHKQGEVRKISEVEEWQA